MPNPPAPSARRPVVVLPTYNNAATVAALTGEIGALGLPVLVVDDGSTDGSGEAAQGAGADVVRHPVNLGKGRALRTGWTAAAERGYSHAITLDADGQHRPADLPAFLEQLDSQPDALVVGSRDMDGEHVPRSSRIGRAISDFMLWAATAPELGAVRPDSQCGYRCYPLAHVLALPMTGSRYEFEMEVLVRASWHGLPLLAVPIDVHYPPPEQRVSHFHKRRDNVRIVGIYTRLMLIRLFFWFLGPKRLLVGRS